MALYLTRFSYTPETWARLTRNPEDRREAAQKYIESVGGKLHGFWYAFALSKLETTPLLTIEETLDALRRAQSVGYRAPGA